MEYKGTYGGSNTPCTIYEYCGWYVIHGSSNVNYTNDKLYDGVNLELVTDCNYFTADIPIFCIEDLEEEVASISDEY